MNAQTRRDAGYTLLEMSMAAMLAVLVGLSVVGLMQAGRSGVTIVRQQAQATGSLRDATARMADELAQSKASRLVVEVLGDQNHQVTFQRPLAQSAGVVTWGTYDVGMAEGERQRVGGYARFTVVASASGRDLVRQTLDDAKKVVRQDVLVRGVATGSAKARGFEMVASGALWRVTVRLAPEGLAPGQTLSFDVSLRN